MPTKTLDLKSTKPLNSSKKKEKGEDFRKELDDKEKKSSDRDHLSGAHQASVEKRSAMGKSAESSKQALRNKSQEQKGIEKTAPTNANANPAAVENKTQAVTTEQQATVVADGMVADNVAATVDLNVAQMESLKKMQAAQLGQAGGLSLEGMTLVNPETVQVPVTQQTSEVPTVMTTETSAAMGAITGVENKSLEADLKGSEGNLSDLQSSSLSDSLQNALQAGGKDKEVSFESVMKATTVAPTDAARESNVNNMIQSARTLLREGGGEMKMILTPEGLGTVDLKINVQGNEVNIEIMAQDQNVKKMFEDGIADIRGALEIQNLKIDNFKVDVSQRADLATGDQQQQDTMNREFARDFMNQFRGERQGMRNQALGYDMERTPNFSKSPEGLRPAGTNTAAGNGRLNLIA